MDKTEQELREEIFQRVGQIFKLRKMNEEFIPGESPVPYAGRIFDEKEMISLVDSSLDFWLTLGRFGERFEKELAVFLNTRHVILTNSGSSSNLLALTALTSPKLGERALKPGDEVITSASSFPTTVNPILQNRLIPVFVDPELGTYNPSAERIEAALSEKTRAIFIAHTLGNPLDLARIGEIAKCHNLYLIEDMCDALGSKFQGRSVGTFGDLATISFYPAHQMTMGEGGAVITLNGKIKQIVESFRDWGRDCWCAPGKDNTCGKRFDWELGGLPYGYDHKYIYSHIGYNLKPVDMQPAIGVEQLKKLPDFVQKRKENFEFFYNEFQKYEKFFVLPVSLKEAEPCWFGFILTVRPSAPFSRSEIVSFLEEKKIATRMLFAGNIIRQPAYQKTCYRVSGELKNADTIMTHSFWFGVYPGITEVKRTYLAEQFHQFMRKYF